MKNNISVALLLRDGQIFLFRKEDKGQEDWSLPSVYFEKDEDGVDAILSWVEDTYWLRILFIDLCTSLRCTDNETTLFFYAVPAFEGEPRLTSGFIGEWFPLNSLPENIVTQFKGLRKVVKELKEYKSMHFMGAIDS